MTLTPTGIETHPSGTINVGGIVNGNWQLINDIFGDTGEGAGILAASVSGSVGGGGLVTLTGAQTITDKTLTSPILNTPTLTGAILGTPASGNLSNCTADGTNAVGTVTFTGTQTLTNKTLTRPSINGPITIHEPLTLSADRDLALTDADAMVIMPDAASADRTLTVRNHSVVALPVGFRTELVCGNNGHGIIVNPDTSNTIIIPPSGGEGPFLVTGPGVAILFQYEVDKWMIFGPNVDVAP